MTTKDTGPRKPSASGRLLVVYNAESSHLSSYREYLDAFSRYSTFDIDYVNGSFGAIVDFDMSAYDIILINYCCLLYHETFTGYDFFKRIRQFEGVKAAILQDEYRKTETIRRRLEDLGIGVVFTGSSSALTRWIYPVERFGDVDFVHCLTAYVPETPPDPAFVRPLAERPIPIGYRGSWAGGWYGDLPYRKVEIAQRMKAACDRRGVAHDIAWEESARVYGDGWLRFVGSCRTMLGTESGANVFDVDGSLEALYMRMLREHGSVDYWNEFRPHLVEKEKGVENGMVSPRIFESIAMMTPMILLEGEYSGVVHSGEHYIELKKDYSNIDDVLDRLDDLPALQAMAERAYRDVIASGAYTYRAFIGRVDEALARRLARHDRRGPVSPAAVSRADHPLAERPTKAVLGPEHHRAKQAAYRRRVPALAGPADLPDDGPVFVHGAGGSGRWILEALRTWGRNVAGFIDSWRSGEFEGLPVQSLTEFLDSGVAKGATVVIASVHHYEIADAYPVGAGVCLYDASPLLTRIADNGLVRALREAES